MRFGPFQLDLRTGELRKHGVRLRLQEQPFQVLAALLDRPGEVVTRDELARRLWADGTVVDYEGGLNAAVTRLRQALADSAETPRYIETVARRGYCWIGPLERIQEAAPPTPPKAPPQQFPASVAAVTTLVAMVLGAVTWSEVRGHSRHPEPAIAVAPLTTGLGAERNVSFSPDGAQIVYEWEQENRQRHIYIKVVGAGDPIPLTSGGAAEYGPEWSPDGRLIAFLRTTERMDLDLYVVPPLGGVERKLTSIASPEGMILDRFVRRLAWTPDASHVIVSAPDRRGHGEGLLLVSLADGAKVWLTNPRPEMIWGDREPAVSPDGRWIAFARGEVGSSEAIHLMRLTDDFHPAGSPQPLSAAGRARSPAWSPDGKEILYTGVSPGMAGSGLWRLRIGGSVPVQIIASGASAGLPAVSRTGQLAFSRIAVTSSVWRREVSSKNQPARLPVRLTKAAAADMNAEYSPDGRRIVFASNRSGTREIWTCDSGGDRCQALTSFGAAYATGSARWSPDGRQIAFDSGAEGRMHIYVVDASGGPPRRVTDDQTGGIVPNWSRDGASIYFSSSRSGTNQIWKIPSGGGTPVQITRAGGFTAIEGPDALFYTKRAEQSDLFRSELDGSGERLVLSGVARRGFVVTKDRIYYLHPGADSSTSLNVFMLQTGADTPIALIHEPLLLGLDLSPDGRSLIYSQMRIASNLMLAKGLFR